MPVASRSFWGKTIAGPERNAEKKILSHVSESRAMKPRRRSENYAMRIFSFAVRGVIVASLAFYACHDTSVTLREPFIPTCQDSIMMHSGEATYYTFASGAGACMFDSTPNDLMIGAMNAIDYAGSQICGACVIVEGPRGTIAIRIVDLCPECPVGNIDLSPLAFSQIADTVLGRVPIRWHVESCDRTGPIIYHFKNGSNQWWTAVQIRNHRNQVLQLEYLTSNHAYKRVDRTNYNYFVEASGMGPGPYIFRVTDVYGHVLVDSGIVHIENGDVPGHGQFPPCDDANQ